MQILHYHEVIILLGMATFCQAELVAQGAVNCLGDKTGTNCGAEELNVTQRRKIIVSTILVPPFMTLKSNGTTLTGNGMFEGYIADILGQIFLKLGYNYEIRVSQSLHEISPEIDYNHLIDRLLNDNADIAAVPFHVREWAETFAFTEPFLSVRLTAMLSRHSSKNNYSSNDVQHRSRDRPIETLDQILHSNISYGVIQGSFAHTFMTASNDTKIKNLWHTGLIDEYRPSAFGSLFPIDELIRRARLEKFALILETSKAEYHSNRQPCDLYTTDYFGEVENFAFAVARSANKTILDRRKRNKELLDNKLVSSRYSPGSNLDSVDKGVNNSTNGVSLLSSNARHWPVDSLHGDELNLKRAPDGEIDYSKQDSDSQNINPKIGTVKLNMHLKPTSTNLMNSGLESESSIPLKVERIRMKRNKKTDRRNKQRMEERRNKEREEEERNIDNNADVIDDDADNDENKRKSKKNKEGGSRDRDRGGSDDKKEKEKEKEEEEEDEEDDDDDKKEEEKKEEPLSFMEEFNRELRRMTKSGELGELYLRWWKDECGTSINHAQRTRQRSGMVQFVQRKNSSTSTVKSSMCSSIAVLLGVTLLQLNKWLLPE